MKEGAVCTATAGYKDANSPSMEAGREGDVAPQIQWGHKALFIQKIT